MGWLFYKSLDEQGEITASSSHLTRPLTVDPRMREMLSAGRGGRGGEGEEVRDGAFVCCCCHSQGLYLLHNQVAAGQTWRETRRGEAELVRKAPVLNL